MTPISEGYLGERLQDHVNAANAIGNAIEAGEMFKAGRLLGYLHRAMQDTRKLARQWQAKARRSAGAE